MAELINLNRARKAKAKIDRETVAAANRVKFGRSKAEKAQEAAEKTMATKLIDAHKRDG